MGLYIKGTVVSVTISHLSPTSWLPFYRSLRVLKRLYINAAMAYVNKVEEKWFGAGKKSEILWTPLYKSRFR